jgi:hypothetical protein
MMNTCMLDVVTGDRDVWEFSGTARAENVLRTCQPGHLCIPAGCVALGHGLVL